MYSHFPKKANIPVILLPLNIVFHTVFVDVSNIAVLQLTITAEAKSWRAFQSTSLSNYDEVY
jgi:hypothetical protein